MPSFRNVITIAWPVALMAACLGGCARYACTCSSAVCDDCTPSCTTLDCGDDVIRSTPGLVSNSTPKQALRPTKNRFEAPKLRGKCTKCKQLLSRCRCKEPLQISYEPPRPPKFLPVPVRPVFSTVNMQAPTSRRGDVEVRFGPQIDFPGHD